MFKSRRIDAYTSLFLLSMVGVIIILLKWGFASVDLVDHQIRHQSQNAVCQVFKTLCQNNTDGIQVRNCADLKNGEFALRASAESSHLKSILNQKLKQKTDIPYSIEIKSNNDNHLKKEVRSEAIHEARVSFYLPSMFTHLITTNGDEILVTITLLLLMAVSYFAKYGKHRIKPFQYFTGGKSNSVITIGRYGFDYEKQTLRIDQNSQRITKRECEVLTYMCRNRNQLVTRDDILTTIWGENDYFNGRSLDVFITRLRKYLARDKHIRIENIHSVGFILNDCYRKQ